MTNVCQIRYISDAKAALESTHSFKRATECCQYMHPIWFPIPRTTSLWPTVTDALLLLESVRELPARGVVFFEGDMERDHGVTPAVREILPLLVHVLRYTTARTSSPPHTCMWGVQVLRYPNFFSREWKQIET